ncbi:hypothetical protein F511_30257 [Dorcoceras hygrometricum]|uniref:Splicing factor 3B subunit 1-like n=1 Tax=Dorcoceras hygrometricum TaxID=472368 RepID=A0A2Z7C6I4_9LAMI|nr:hypothetical protein F511_30257 [Dorcoceras hygrometricum]
MVTMFKTLESTGLRGFLGCTSAIYEVDLEAFFANALVRENAVISSVQGKFIEISKELFIGSFELPSEGQVTVNELPKELLNEAMRAFSVSGEPIKTSCKKKEMKVEFRLLNDILAKTVTAKVGSFDAVTHERFLLMAAIHGVQICVILKGAPDLTLGESKAFAPLKILTVKIVGTYIAKNKLVSTTAEEVTDELVVAKVVKAAAKRRPDPATEPIVGTYIAKNKLVSTTAEEVTDELVVAKVVKAAAKRRPDPATEPVAKKKRTTVGRAAPTEKNLALVPVVIEAEPISVVPAESPTVQRRQAPKRKLILLEDTDEEETEKEESEKIAVEETTEQEIAVVETEEKDKEEPVVVETAEETIEMETVETETDKKEKDDDEKVEKEKEEKEKDKEDIDSEDTEPLRKVLKLTETSMSDEESMSIDDLLKQIPEDMMLPSVTAEDPTKIKFGRGIAFRKVDWHKATIPTIDPANKEKEPLVEEIKGNPAKEMFTLICDDV